MALAVYGELRLPGEARYADGNQHDYDDLSDEAIHRVLGEVADADSLGVFIDCEPRTIDGIYVYSVPRLAASIAERFPHLVAKFAGHGAIVNALDAGSIDVDEAEYPIARLVGNIVNVARGPVGGRPALRILW